jgi:small subunit ribosomal protein S3Ae
MPSLNVAKEHVVAVCQFLKGPEGGAYTLLTDETAADYPKREKRFDIVYHLYSFERNNRLRLRVQVGAGEKVSSVTGVWPTANWLEREFYDMFGVVYDGHPDLKRILLPDEWVGHPLRKDYDILKQDPQHYNYKLFFQVDKVEGEEARSIFKGHEYSREFLRSLIRRGSSMSDFIKEYKTKDGYGVRVYCTALSQGKMNSSKKHDLRIIMDRVIGERAASLTYDQFAQEMVLQKVASDVYNEAKRVTHLRHVGIRKSKLVSRPEQKSAEALAPLAA